jgi:UDPglucose--hexose-1-phosphate uridylyltransferase
VSERRLDPTTGEWVTFATHRQDRTFLPPAEYCPLCPTRPGAFPTEVPREHYDLVVFDNKFPSLSLDPGTPSARDTELMPVEPGFGHCEVVLYSEVHDSTLAQMAPSRIRNLVEVWADRYAVLGAVEGIDYVFIFENKGEAIGVTLSHPHGQIYGYPEVPPKLFRELVAATEHHDATGRCVFCDVIARERAEGARVVAENDVFLAFVPFWARYPYEVHVVARRHAPSLLDLSPGERDGLAALLKDVLTGYDALWGFSLPYIMGLHQAPTDGADWDDVTHFHIELTPPNRTAQRLKYLAGSESSAGAFINDTVPEATAGHLREAVDRARAERGLAPANRPPVVAPQEPT